MSRQTLDEYLQESRREIAIFMGATLIPGRSPEFDQYLIPQRGCVSVSNLLYDRSMEWAMEVVERIEALGPRFVIKKNNVEVEGKVLHTHNFYTWASGITEDTKLMSTFYGIAEFVKTYNLRDVS